MTHALSTPAAAYPTPTVFRVDKFAVPADVLPAFMQKMLHIQQTVRTLPGCLRDLVLTQTAGSGHFNVVHLVEWVSADAVTAAQALMQKKFADEGFDPAAFFVRELGAQADLGIYVPV